MKVRYLAAAVADLAALRAYIALERPAAAKRVAARIRSCIGALIEDPYLAPECPDMSGVRRLAITGTPYLVFHRIAEAEGRIEVLRILHGVQQWPPAGP